MTLHLRAVLAVTIAVTVVAVADAQQRGLRGRIAARRGEKSATAVGAQSVTITVQGMSRRYLLHAPTAASGAVVLAFHGGGETPENQEEISNFDALSDRDRFIVAYPEGVGKSWNDGRGTTTAEKDGVDDVAFAKAIVADIAKSHTVDRARVYATGPSNGGIFVNRLACDAADTFAAVAPVIGTIGTTYVPKCHPSTSVAVVGVQGVADPVVPFNGGEVGGTLKGSAAGGNVESSRATQEFWRSQNGCGATVTSTALPVRVQDGTSVTKRVYSGCRSEASVVWYEIEGGGHRWPPHHADGIKEAMAKRTLGASSQNIDASDVIWNFFSQHHR
ncbi:MAG TPA: PHB depolymerase family esterase [Vicinamibacterales bacterium]|nr:PHB depolymerase family esterase [Vicinamibacterales bacterium]